MSSRYLLALLAITLAACGGTAGQSHAASYPDETAPTLPLNQGTTTTIPLIPTPSGQSTVCNAYFTVAADNVLASRMGALPAGLAESAQAAYKRSLTVLATSPSIATQPSVVSSLSDLYGLGFGKASAKYAPAGALANLDSVFSASCQATGAPEGGTSGILSAAAGAGWNSACDSGAAIAVSAADPTYVSISAPAKGASLPTGGCLPMGYAGLLIRQVSAQAWTAMLPFAQYPCGQAPPAILLSLYGPTALAACFPG